MKKTKLLACVLLTAGSLLTCIQATDAGPKTFDFNARCQQAYRDILMLKVQQGDYLLEVERSEHPDNLMGYFLQNYSDLMKLFFLENHQQYESQLFLLDKCISLMQEGPRNSPYYLYTQAVLHAQWGLIKLKFGDHLSAMWDIRKCYLLLKTNLARFPQFQPDKILYGAIRTLIGTVPANYRWVTNILGFSNGSVREGMAMLGSYVNDPGNESGAFRMEALFLYCYLRFYIQHQPKQTMDFIQHSDLDLKNNKLFNLMTVNLAMNAHMAEYGLKVASEMSQSSDYLQLPMMSYELGLLHLYHMDLPQAVHYLNEYLDHFQGDFYIKDALLEMSRAYYLMGNTQQALKVRAEVLQRGSAVVDADKAAIHEAEKGYLTDPVILKARMLMNGGFYSQALQTIEQKKVEDFPRVQDKIEYAYFLARIYDELGAQDKALNLYDVTIKAAEDRPEYFAARSALQAGFIFEQRRDTSKALSYFRKCLDMHEQEYKTSLDQRAKAGINRLSVH